MIWRLFGAWPFPIDDADRWRIIAPVKDIVLTHLDRNKMAAILQTTLSN